MAAHRPAGRVLALDDALVRPRGRAGRRARVVECRLSGGLTEAEAAGALRIGPRTA